MTKQWQALALTDEQRLAQAHEALRHDLRERRRVEKSIAGHRAVISYLRSQRRQAIRRELSVVSA